MKNIRQLITDRRQAFKTAKPKQRDIKRQAYKIALVCQQLRKESRSA